MVEWHCQLSGHEFEQTPRDSERQGSLVCCSSWGRKESDMTEELNKGLSIDVRFSMCFCYRVQAYIAHHKTGQEIERWVVEARKSDFIQKVFILRKWCGRVPNESVSHSVMPDSLRSHGLQPITLLCPWGFPGKDIGVVCHFLLQGIFPTQGSNPGLLHCRQILYQPSYQGKMEGSQRLILYKLKCRVLLY